MGSLYRSVEMCRCQLFLQSESAYPSVAELGELGLTMFKDLNPDVNAFQRSFVNEVRRCAEMERKLRFVEKEIKMEQIDILDTDEIPPCPHANELANLESTFEKLETDIIEMNDNGEAMRQNYTSLLELKNILYKAQLFFPEAALARLMIRGDSVKTSQTSTFVAPDKDPLKSKNEELDLNFIVGTIAQAKLQPFERVLWRATRGNVFLRLSPIEEPIMDPKTREYTEKSIFVVFYQGPQLKNRVMKIIEGFRATAYEIPDTPNERKEMYDKILTQIEDLKMEIGGGSVPYILNMVETNNEIPPTWFRTNKFTEGFQNLVESYGVASYREANPAPFTIITFPFLFAVMFGDVGHGLIMFLFALFLVVKEKYLERQKIRDEIFTIFFGGRYIILLMGAFSLYTGVIYNELFSKSFNIFGSSWRIDYSDSTIEASDVLTLDPADNNTYLGYPYPLGVDPIWNLASNKLTFLNSFKMKLSVVIGISQMVFGVFLSLSNFKYFKSPLDIFAVFVPQIIFISAIFVYLCGLIFYKWIVFSASPQLFNLHIPYNASVQTCNPNLYLSTNCAPSLLIGLINMFMFSEKEPGFCSTTCSDGEFYPHQAMVQHFLVVLAVICVPWMLLIKPFVLRSRFNKAAADKESKKQLLKSDVNDGVEEGNGELPEIGKSVENKIAEREEFDFAETFIHQAINTIEYCLGCISHTASYLRLWALSLAHSELSEVLWSMVMSMGFKMNGYVGSVVIYAIFWAFAAITIAVLLVMEGLSAFLHALRLHWVEFQSKFYVGDGYMFEPFSFTVILKECEENLIANY